MTTYEQVMDFKKKYRKTITWFRLRKHCAIVDKHLNPGEVINYVMAGQLDNNHSSFFNTGVLAITNERLIIAQSRILVGYKFTSITPDLYNDLEVEAGLIWGLLTIDTVKEKVYVSDIDKKALPEIETKITMFMQNAKKKYKDGSSEDIK